MFLLKPYYTREYFRLREGEEEGGISTSAKNSEFSSSTMRRILPVSLVAYSSPRPKTRCCLYSSTGTRPRTCSSGCTNEDMLNSSCRGSNEAGLNVVMAAMTPVRRCIFSRGLSAYGAISFSPRDATRPRVFGTCVLNALRCKRLRRSHGVHCTEYASGLRETWMLSASASRTSSSRDGTAMSSPSSLYIMLLWRTTREDHVLDEKTP